VSEVRGKSGNSLGSVSLFPDMSNDLGTLIPFEFYDMPFRPARAFIVRDVPSGGKRGIHAHKQCEQLLVSLQGLIVVEMTDGSDELEKSLSSPSDGLYIPPMTWASQSYESADAVLLVFASHPYSRSDYIEDYQEFLELRGTTVSSKD